MYRYLFSNVSECRELNCMLKAKYCTVLYICNVLVHGQHTNSPLMFAPTLRTLQTVCCHFTTYCSCIHSHVTLFTLNYPSLAQQPLRSLNRLMHNKESKCLVMYLALQQCVLLLVNQKLLRYKAAKKAYSGVWDVNMCNVCTYRCNV